MLRSTPLQMLSVVKIAPESGAALSTPPASNDPIASAAIIAPRANVIVFVSFIFISLGWELVLECFRATVLTVTQEKFLRLTGPRFIPHLLIRKRRGEVYPGKAHIYLPTESRMNI